MSWRYEHTGMTGLARLGVRFIGGGGGDGGASAQARQQEQNRQNNIRNGLGDINNIFNGQFGEDFYNGRKQAYLDYATPQLTDQYADAQKKLAYALDRQGITNSSARAEKDAELQKLYDTNQRSVNDQALNYENTARNNVASAKNDLINQLQSTGDNSATVQNSMARAAALTAPDTYSPLSQLFSTFTNALGTQAQLEQNAALTGGLITPRYNTGLFGTNVNAVKKY